MVLGAAAVAVLSCWSSKEKLMSRFEEARDQIRILPKGGIGGCV